MRTLTLVPLLVLAACSDNAGADQKAADAAAKANLTLAAGQWETTAKYDNVTVVEGTEPAIKAAVGEAATASACVGEAEGKKPQPALFAAAGDTCTYQNFYMARGRINADMRCRRDGAEGDIMVMVQGTYDTDSFDLTTDTRTILAGAGDIHATGTLTGRHAGQCTAAPAEATS